MIIDNYFALDALANLVKKNPKWEWILAKMWNEKWTTYKKTYKAQKYEMDVRNLICVKSFVLEPVISNLNKLSNDEKALAILKLVKNRLIYKGDFETKGTPEYWELPEISWQNRYTDCEDGSILIASLMRISGIPSYRVKVCAGDVVSPENKDALAGHAYVIYLSEEKNRWYVLDWCFFYSQSVTAFKTTEHRLMTNYKGIWFTFNDEWCWCQKDTIIK